MKIVCALLVAKIFAEMKKDSLGLLDLDNLHPSDLRLDDAPAQVFALPGGALFVDHADPLGRATIVPGPTASRDDAIVLSGFLLADLLEER